MYKMKIQKESWTVFYISVIYLYIYQGKVRTMREVVQNRFIRDNVIYRRVQVPIYYIYHIYTPIIYLHIYRQGAGEPFGKFLISFNTQSAVTL